MKTQKRNLLRTRIVLLGISAVVFIGIALYWYSQIQVERSQVSEVNLIEEYRSHKNSTNVIKLCEYYRIKILKNPGFGGEYVLKYWRDAHCGEPILVHSSQNKPLYWEIPLYSNITNEFISVLRIDYETGVWMNFVINVSGEFIKTNKTEAMEIAKVLLNKKGIKGNLSEPILVASYGENAIYWKMYVLDASGSKQYVIKVPLIGLNNTPLIEKINQDLS